MNTQTDLIEALQELSHVLSRPLRKQARRDGLAWLATLPGGDLVWLDYLARYNTIYRGPAIGGRPDPTESTGLGAVLASLHSDGRLREHALAHLRGELATIFLALRTADHVPQIRARARELLFALPADPAALGVLLAVRRRLRGEGVLDDYANRLSADQLSSVRAAGERDLRRWAYQHGLSTGTLALAELKVGALDNDQWVRARCADALAQKADADLAPVLLTSRYVETRMAGLLRLPDELLSDARIEEALFDRSARVRELAQWRCRRRGGDPAKVYRAEVHRASTAEQGAAVRSTGLVAGLTETGQASDLPLIVGYLADPRARVRLAAVKAVTGWLDGVERARLLGPLLLDDSRKVIEGAAIGLASLPGATADEYVEAAWSSDQAASRRGAMRVELARGPWSVLEGILRLIADPDPAAARDGRVMLTSWFRTTAGGGRLPDEDQKARLRSRMDGVWLDDATIRQLNFSARL